MSIEINGIDEINENFDRIQSNADELSTAQNVDLITLFDQGFLTNRTEYKNFENLLYSSGFNSEHDEIKSYLESDKFNKFLADKTEFNSWEDLYTSASMEYVKKQLFSGLQ